MEGVQGPKGASHPIGYVLGIREAGVQGGMGSTRDRRGHGQGRMKDLWIVQGEGGWKDGGMRWTLSPYTTDVTLPV